VICASVAGSGGDRFSQPGCRHFLPASLNMAASYRGPAVSQVY